MARVMRHRVSMPRPDAHLFHVELTVEEPGEALLLGMPVWTPGSYLVREHARHVEGLEARAVGGLGGGAPDVEVGEAGVLLGAEGAGAGRSLPVERVDKHRFRVETGGAAVARVSYRVYANELTVRTCHLDGTHGFFNGAGLLLYVEGREREAQRLEIEAPPGWAVATALAPAPGEPDPFATAADSGRSGCSAFVARDYDELVDSPVEVGTHRLLTFEALGRPHALAVWGRSRIDLGRLARDAQRLVEHFGAMMGGLPYARYLFLVHLTAASQGGLEHAASAALHVKRSASHPPEAYEDELGLLAHEFFHAWNVKELRPAAFMRYDYGREQYTRLLWWFEGATSYYDELALVRTGLAAPGRLLRKLGEELTRLARTPGAAKMSLEEASFLAWVKLYRPDENTPNSAVSYYRKGALVAFALDLALRRAGASLDALARRLVERHRERGLPEDGVERAAAEILGAEAARAFFDRHVRGAGDVQLDLGLLGLEVRRRRAQGFDDKGGKAAPRDDRATPGWLGAVLAPGAKLVVGSVLEGSPAWAAGLYPEDEIAAVDRYRVDRAGLWDRLCDLGPGGALKLAVFRRDELLELEVPLGEPPEDALWIDAVQSPSPEQRAAFEAWCGAPLPPGAS
jgi:predicted metalloprotease with PDZ domain